MWKLLRRQEELQQKHDTCALPKKGFVLFGLVLHDDYSFGSVSLLAEHASAKAKSWPS
jgi:hypothetical protein